MNYQGKTVLVTGHTGFKGTWLTLWLQLLGAKVIGYSLSPPTSPNLYDMTHLKDEIVDHRADIRNLQKLTDVIAAHQPTIIFHLAAQPIVLHSLKEPKETFDVNVTGTINVIEAAREVSSVRALLVITTDKCYENRGWIWGYREADPLGGHEPYSASKAMAEIAAGAYRTSFQTPLIATARAGNVIGGGDFSEFRLVPDAMKALMKKQTIEVRNPNSIRPWLHVLDPLYGYLKLGEKLLVEGAPFADAWNFGPKEQAGITAAQIAEKSVQKWGSGGWRDVSQKEPSKEMPSLRLNWEKAAHYLNWQPKYSWEEAIEKSVQWYKAFQEEKEMHDFTVKQIEAYAV